MKIKNTGKRAFIVKAEDVQSGGEKHPDGSIFINAGDTVEIADDVGEKLTSYPDIMVISRRKKQG